MDRSLIRQHKVDTQRAREVSMYGCTVEQMREAVEESLAFRFSGPVMYALSLMSDCQEMLAQQCETQMADYMVREDVRQALNRAKWILGTYAMDQVQSA